MKNIKFLIILNIILCLINFTFVFLKPEMFYSSFYVGMFNGFTALVITLLNVKD